MRTFWIFVLVATLTLPLMAQEHQHADHHSDEELGEVNFPVSCGPERQAEFNRAVAMLHDFWYAEAEKAFQAIAQTEPQCGMAFWGVAMSNYHPLWAPPSPEEMERGKSAVANALKTSAKTEREKGYISAIAVFYTDVDKIPHKTRAKSYADAMEKVHQQNPDDMEAAILHALALLATADASDKTYAVQKKAADILNPLVEKAPSHPGIAHYIIHSFDYPALAELALPAARTYAKIAPSSPHALHMPSHIFTRLGLWEESINSNIASASRATTHLHKRMPDAMAFDALHAMDYLVYAYLQLGQEDKARKIMEEAAAATKVDQTSFAAAYAFAAMPARYAIERHQWKEAAALQVRPQWFPWDKFAYAEAITHYAIGIGSARSGNIDSAKKAAERLAVLQKSLEATDKYWAGQVEIQRQTVVAWIAFAEGKKEEGLTMMRAAAALEDSTEKHPVTPGVIMPAHELVAEMLLEKGEPAQAALEFEQSLKSAPNRRHPSTHQKATTKN